jgi:hypothetical protein
MLPYLKPYKIQFNLLAILAALSLILGNKGIYLLDIRELRRP